MEAGIPTGKQLPGICINGKLIGYMLEGVATVCRETEEPRITASAPPPRPRKDGDLDT